MGDSQIVEWPVLSNERLDAWIANVLNCFTEKEYPKDEGLIAYAELFAVLMRQASKQIIGEVGDLVRMKGGEELGIYEEELNVYNETEAMFL